MSPFVTTQKGTKIARFRGVVGKLVSGAKSQLYVHRDYATLVIPKEGLVAAAELAEPHIDGWLPRAVMYEGQAPILTTGAPVAPWQKARIRFDEAPDFDQASEPRVGRTVSVDMATGAVVVGASNAVWHHKWLWVQDDYQGFDPIEARAWSARWLEAVPEVAKGGSLAAWQAQLARFGLRQPRANPSRQAWIAAGLLPLIPP